LKHIYYQFLGTNTGLCGGIRGANKLFGCFTKRWILKRIVVGIVNN